MNTNNSTGAENSESLIQLDLFDACFPDLSPKSDLSTLIAPFFSISKDVRYNLKPRNYYNPSTKYRVRVTPSEKYGCATIFDKELIMFACSQLLYARDNGLPVSPTLLIDTHKFLVYAKRGDSATAYSNIFKTIIRLRRTFYETNMPSNGTINIGEFSLISEFDLVDVSLKSDIEQPSSNDGLVSPDDVKSIRSFKITLCNWLYNHLTGEKVEALTIDEQFFDLKSGFDRRLLEIGSKHLGVQTIFVMGLDKLHHNVGSTRDIKFTRQAVREAIKSKSINKFNIAFDAKADNVIFYSKDSRRFSMYLLEQQNTNGQRDCHWYDSLERSDNA